MSSFLALDAYAELFLDSQFARANLPDIHEHKSGESPRPVSVPGTVSKPVRKPLRKPLRFSDGRRTALQALVGPLSRKSSKMPAAEVSGSCNRTAQEVSNGTMPKPCEQCQPQQQLTNTGRLQFLLTTRLGVQPGRRQDCSEMFQSGTCSCITYLIMLETSGMASSWEYFSSRH